MAEEIDKAAGREVAGGRGATIGTVGEASSTNGDITRDTESSGDGGIAFGSCEAVRDVKATSGESAGDIEGVAEETSLGGVTCVLLLPPLLLVVATVLSVLAQGQVRRYYIRPRRHDGNSHLLRRGQGNGHLFLPLHHWRSASDMHGKILKCARMW